MAELPLLILSLDDLSRETIRRVAKILAISKTVRIERKGLRILDSVAKDAIKAYRSKVPIATGQLRNTQILARFTSTKPFTPTATVYVADTPHTNSRGATKPTGAQLAQLLDTMAQKRSRGSMAEDPFNPATSEYSAGWIAEATNELKDYVHNTLGL